MKKKIMIIGLLTMLLCMLAGMDAGAYYLVDFPITVTVYYDISRETIDLFNEERVKNGLNELTVDSGLMDEAIQRAAELVLWFSHNRPGGSLPGQAYQCNASGENIAYGYASASGVFNGWMTSAGHKATAMYKAWNSTAVILVKGPEGGTFWVQLFDEDEGDGKYNTGTSTATRTVQFSNGNVFFARTRNNTVTYGEKCNDTPIYLWNRWLDENGQDGKWVYVCPPSMYTIENSNPDVATVDVNGYVYPHKVGTTTLTVKLKTYSASEDDNISEIPITVEPLNIWMNINGLDTAFFSYEKSWVYTGNDICPTVHVTDMYGNTLVANQDYTVTYENNIEAGSNAYIKVAGIGNYTGIATLRFTIAKPSGSTGSSTAVTPGQTSGSTSGSGTGSAGASAAVTPGQTSGSTSGSGTGSAGITTTLTPGQTSGSTAGNGTGSAGTATTVTPGQISGPTAGNGTGSIGSTTVTSDPISGSTAGIESGSAETSDSGSSAALTNTTAPKKASISSLKSKAKKKLTIKWKKISGVTGYQIQYSTSKKFKSAKTKTVKGAKKVSVTVTKLKSKKTYYVRIRAYKTVNGGKVYGAWSKVKKEKVK